MNAIKRNLEIYFWLVVFLTIILLISPIYIKTGNLYPFYVSNIVAIFIFLTFTRLIFLLKYAPYARLKWFRMIMIFLPIPLLMYHIDSFFAFREFIEEEGVISFFKGSSDMSDYRFGKFIRNQYMFFLVGSIITMVLMPVRMMVSFWRTTNTKDKV